MKIINVALLSGFLMFYYLILNFSNLGGMDFPLLKIIIELIVLLLFFNIISLKDYIIDIIFFDKNQKTIYDFFKKT